jgi:hypothetical protein
MDRTDFGVMACSYPLWDRVLARLESHEPACGRTGRERPLAIEPRQLYQVWFGTQTSCGHSVAGDYGAARGPGHSWDSGAISAGNDIGCGSAKPYAIMVLDCGKTVGASLGNLAPKEKDQRLLSLVRVPE